jgi:hypothetical protein
MTTTNQKLEILQSLNNLDAVQSEIVLKFIQGLIQGDGNRAAHHQLKRKAMREIGQALKQSEHSF